MIKYIYNIHRITVINKIINMLLYEYILHTNIEIKKNFLINNYYKICNI